MEKANQNSNHNDPRPSYYKNIDIEKDLELKDFTFQRLGKEEVTFWIQDIRTNKGLQVITDPMKAVYPKVYPYGNYIRADATDEEKKKRPYDPKEMEKAQYVLRLQELETNSECFAWLLKLEHWYVEEAAKRGAWLKEQNDIKMKINEELEDDNETLTLDQFNKRFWKRFLGGMGTMIRFQQDKETRQPLKNDPRFFSIKEKVYHHFDVNKGRNDVHQWDLTEKQHLIDVHFSQQKENIITNASSVNGENNVEWFKKMIPLFNEKCKEIPQSEARINHGDHVSCKISFKKRDMGGYGLSRKFVWIQIIKKAECETNGQNSIDRIDGPIDWNEFGTDYMKLSKVQKIDN